MNKPAVVVTGASTGIGYATAHHLIKQGMHVFGSVRKPADAERVQNELGDSFTPLLFDVTDRDAIEAAAEIVRQALDGKKLTGLVNNAGLVYEGPAIYQPLDEVRAQFEVNFFGVVQVIQTFIPLLGEDQTLEGDPGRIINVSSVAGKLGGLFLSAYAGTKHALEGYSESLRRELLLFGIDVVIVGPGSVATPIWDKSEAFDTSQYDESPYAKFVVGYKKYMLKQGRAGLNPLDVAHVVFTALTHPRPRVRYPVVKRFFQDWLLLRLLPPRMLDSRIGKAIGFIK